MIGGSGSGISGIFGTGNGPIGGNTLTHFPCTFLIYPGAHLHIFVPGTYPYLQKIGGGIVGTLVIVSMGAIDNP